MSLPSLSGAAAKAELRDLLRAAEDLTVAEWEAADQSSAGARAGATGLDRITQLGLALIDYEQRESVRLVTETLLRLYRYGEGQLPIGGAGTSDLAKAHRWKSVIIRVFALGAFAVYRSDFGVVRELALQAPDPRYPKQHWSRATVTALARGGTFAPKTLIPAAADYISDHPVLFERFRENKDELVNTLCQFDFLQCVAVIHETGDFTRCYPNFGSYFKERTEPIVSSLVTGGSVRVVVPNASNTRLAEIIRALDEGTSRAFFDYAGWEMGGWMDGRIEDFLKQYAPKPA